MVFTPLYERVLKRILVEKSVDFMQQLPIDRPKNPFEVALRFPLAKEFKLFVVMTAGNRRWKYALPRAVPCIFQDQIGPNTCKCIQILGIFGASSLFLRTNFVDSVAFMKSTLHPAPI
ncbi:hypothetical protein ASF91_07950 [Rhizobium sp. Leaf155]|nr:hypothetical protein ASF91_07950 [Rhizobium sp. Leaf155]